MEIALYIVGAVAVVLLVAVIYLIGLRWRDLEQRITDLEQERATRRLSHRDTLNLENAASAFVKTLVEMDQLSDYLRNGMTWLGKVRGLAGGDDDDDQDL